LKNNGAQAVEGLGEELLLLKPIKKQIPRFARNDKLSYFTGIQQSSPESCGTGTLASESVLL
jgi:hypothetical protein